MSKSFAIIISVISITFISFVWAQLMNVSESEVETAAVVDG